LRLYGDLLRLRKTDPALRPGGTHDAKGITEGAVILRRSAGSGEAILVLAAFKPGVVAAVHEPGLSVVLTTEDVAYTAYSRRPAIIAKTGGTVVHFTCPAAVVFRNSLRQD
jgi:hypothetical protein